MEEKNNWKKFGSMPHASFWVILKSGRIWKLEKIHRATKSVWLEIRIHENEYQFWMKLCIIDGLEPPCSSSAVFYNNFISLLHINQNWTLNAEKKTSHQFNCERRLNASNACWRRMACEIGWNTPDECLVWVSRNLKKKSRSETILWKIKLIDQVYVCIESCNRAAPIKQKMIIKSEICIKFCSIWLNGVLRSKIEYFSPNIG